MSLASFAPDQAFMMRWPPLNGGFVMGFHPETARRIKQDGYIILNGRRAKVMSVSLQDDDPRIDFQFEEVPNVVPQGDCPFCARLHGRDKLCGSDAP